jgi:hypothetical protein
VRRTPTEPVRHGEWMPLTPEERDSFRSEFGVNTVFVITGDLVEITYVEKQRKQRVSKRRGHVGPFSRESRMRLMRRCSTIDWSSALPAVFITLTWPDDRVVTSGRVRTQERDCFFAALERRMQRHFSVLWRTEWKPRLSGALKGHVAPHVHLIVLSCSFISFSEVNRLWCGVLGADGYVRTDIRKIRTPDHAGRYVAKYTAKLPDDLSLVNTSKISVEGRHWGIHRRNLVPWCEKKVFVSNRKDLVKLMENAACSIFPHFTRDARQGFCLFGDLGRKIGAEILARISGHENQ